jgi:prevent-host-death family protein
MMSLSEVRAALHDVVRRAENGEEIWITRRGVPIAVIHASRTEG